MDSAHVLVTGASGFVGRAVVAELCRLGHRVTGAVRHAGAPGASAACRYLAVGDIGADTDWRGALTGVDVVVHLAGRVHVMHEAAADPLAEFRAINVLATRRLAEGTAVAGARRFVFVSSIKVNGEQTSPGMAFRPDDAPSPQDAYGLSKWEAEQALAELAARTGLEIVILRPPLVYGPGVGANFLRLLRLIESGWPLPLASVTDNRRSMIYVGNLVDAILRCAEHPAAAGRTFLVSDGEDLSTAALIRQLAMALGRPPRLLPCPPAALALAARLVGKQAEANRLLGSLAVDAAPIRQTLDWTPPFSVAQGIEATVRWHAAPRR